MNNCSVIGLMSGTSLDGLDIAWVDFRFENHWNYKIIQCETVPYKEELSSKLRLATDLSAYELKQLDIAYGKWIGEKVRIFMNTHNFTPYLIASHGHTVFHQPDIGLTQQIGDGYQIMLQTAVKTICDFRSLDVAKGGQGAPLVPIGDMLLFPTYDICLNLGGFSNVSMQKHGRRIAFDICPVNTILNHLSAMMGQAYDAEGAIAKTGTVNQELLKKLNGLPYYAQAPPKSLGIEWVQEQILPLLQHDTTENLLATFCQHIGEQVAAVVTEIPPTKNSPPKMLITGGGARNSHLISLIRKEVDGKIEVEIPDSRLVDFKEAIIFGFLGLLRSRGEINALKSVTGAKSDSSCGLIYENI